MKKLLAILLTAAICFGFTGCSANDQQDGQVPGITENQVIPSAQKGGELIISMQSPKTLNPLHNGSLSVDRILKLVFDPLFAADEEQRMSPVLVNHYTWNPDGTVVTLELKNTVFHDGIALTADDVIYSLQVLRDAPEESLYRKHYEYITDYTKISDRSLQIRFKNAGIGNLYALSFPIIPQHYYLGDGTDFAPVGTGVYRFAAYQSMDHLLLEASPTPEKMPYIDSIRVNITADRDTDIYSFEQGLIDVVVENLTELGQYGISAEKSIAAYDIMALDFIGFNFNKSLFQDAAVRKAIAYCIPKKQLIESIYLDYAEDAPTPVHPNSYLFEEDVERYDYNTEKAREVLASAGWVDTDEDTLLDKELGGIRINLDFQILVNEESQERCRVADYLSQELSFLGIQAQVIKLPFEEYAEKLAKRDFDVFIGGWEMSLVPDISFMLHSSQAANGDNFGDYKSDTLDGLLEMAASSVEEASAIENYAQLQKYIAQELPVIAIVFRKGAVVRSANVLGPCIPSIDNVYRNIQDWYMRNI